MTLQEFRQARVPEFLLRAPYQVPSDVYSDIGCYFGRPQPIARKVILPDNAAYPLDYRVLWTASRLTGAVNVRQPDSLHIWAAVSFLAPVAPHGERIVNSVLFPGAWALSIYEYWLYFLYRGTPVLPCQPPCLRAHDACLDWLAQQMVTTT